MTGGRNFEGAICHDSQAFLVFDVRREDESRTLSLKFEVVRSYSARDRNGAGRAEFRECDLARQADRCLLFLIRGENRTTKLSL